MDTVERTRSRSSSTIATARQSAVSGPSADTEAREVGAVTTPGLRPRGSQRPLQLQMTLRRPLVDRGLVGRPSDATIITIGKGLSRNTRGYSQVRVILSSVQN